MTNDIVNTLEYFKIGYLKLLEKYTQTEDDYNRIKIEGGLQAINSLADFININLDYIWEELIVDLKVNINLKFCELCDLAIHPNDIVFDPGLELIAHEECFAKWKIYNININN